MAACAGSSNHKQQHAVADAEGSRRLGAVAHTARTHLSHRTHSTAHTAVPSQLLDFTHTPTLLPAELLEGEEGFALSQGTWQRDGWRELDDLRKKLERLQELRELVRGLGRSGGKGPLRRAPEEVRGRC